MNNNVFLADNGNERMEAETILKNGHSLKTRMISSLVKQIFLFLVFICFSVNIFGQTTSSKVERIWIDHDVTQNNQRGMIIHVKFTIDGMLNKQGICAVWFYNSNESPLKTNNNNRYKTSSGNATVQENFRPSYANAVYNDFTLFMPYSELNLGSGTNNLKLKVGIIDHNDRQVTISAFQSFSYNNTSICSNNRCDGKGFLRSNDPNCVFCRGRGEITFSNGPSLPCSGCRVHCPQCTERYVDRIKKEGNVYPPVPVPPTPGPAPIIRNNDPPIQCRSCSGSGRCNSCSGAGTTQCKGCWGSGRSTMGGSGICGTYSGRGVNNCLVCSRTGRCVGCRGKGTL